MGGDKLNSTVKRRLGGRAAGTDGATSSPLEPAHGCIDVRLDRRAEREGGRSWNETNIDVDDGEYWFDH